MALYLPAGVDQLSRLSTWGNGPYPPTSLAVFEDYSLGNGDNYGLYWPIGRETREPLVVETVHDAGALVPAFSSLDRFLTLTADLDEADHAEWPTIDQDPASPHGLLQAARAALRTQDFAGAAGHLLIAVETLPEYTAALSLLTTLLIRDGMHDEACRMGIRAVRSPPSFAMGADLDKTWAWLSKQSEGPADVRADAIWSRRTSLTTAPRGGMKENSVYPALLGAVDAYADGGEIVEAITLMQTVAEYMERETISFRERQGFDAVAHRERQLDLEAHLPDGPRVLP